MALIYAFLLLANLLDMLPIGPAPRLLGLIVDILPSPSCRKPKMKAWGRVVVGQRCEGETSHLGRATHHEGRIWNRDPAQGLPDLDGNQTVDHSGDPKVGRRARAEWPWSNTLETSQRASEGSGAFNKTAAGNNLRSG
jgi:hypothetical protein